MIKLKGAYKSKDGGMLELQTSIRGAASIPALAAALADVVARFVQHAKAIYGDELNIEDFLDCAYDEAQELIDELPELTDNERQTVKTFNDEPDPEPNYSSAPSHRAEQVLTCGMILRADGFQVSQEDMHTDPVPFDELPTAAAGMIGAMSAHLLTCSGVPADMLANESEAVENFKGAWAINMGMAQTVRIARAQFAHARWLSRLLGGKLDARN